MTKLQRALHAERITEKHNDKRIYSSQTSLLLSKEDLLTVHELGEYRELSPNDMLKQWEVFKALDGLADNITDQDLIEMFSLAEDERREVAKSNEHLGRSLGLKNLITQKQEDWTNRLDPKLLLKRLARKSDTDLKQLQQLPNRTLREAVEQELSRRATARVKSKQPLRNLDKTYAITGDGSAIQTQFPNE